MDLYREIIIDMLKSEEFNITLKNLTENMSDKVEMKCYKALQKIKAVINDDSLSDSECFIQIEQIIRIFEELGSNGGNRHDY